MLHLLIGKPPDRVSAIPGSGAACIMVSPPEAGEGLPDHPIAESSIPSPEAVRQQLQAILASRPFVTATRARRFLTYVVEQTLAGQTDAIKELVLGIEVFDRPADFDPKLDTIVRVEAGKLRKRIEEYYADEGIAAAVRIEVPKGTYVPQFQYCAPGAYAEEPCPAFAPVLVWGRYSRAAPGRRRGSGECGEFARPRRR